MKSFHDSPNSLHWARTCSVAAFKRHVLALYIPQEISCSASVDLASVCLSYSTLGWKGEHSLAHSIIKRVHQAAAPTESSTLTLQRARIAQNRLRLEGWRQRRLSSKAKNPQK
jgi:hypothetical protein